MRPFLLNVYLNSPPLLKRVFANMEAVRRDRYRGNRNSRIIREKNSSIEKMRSNNCYFDRVKLNNLLSEAATHVEHYTFLSGHKINSVDDFQRVPLLTKQMIIKNRDSLISSRIRNKRQLWNGSSSGSTGTPLKYYRDRRSIMEERFNYESYYKYCGCDFNERRIRISGVKTTRFERKKPPYWLYIDKYKQLQCSAYHISDESFNDYLNKFKKANVSYGTGYPSAWSVLAEIMLNKNNIYNGLKAIITDSEGMSADQKKNIEKVFNCKVYQTYGLGEVGMCAIQCKNSNYHILPSHYIEVVDNEGICVNDGIVGEIVVTDFNSTNYPYIRYATGDLGVMYHNDCGCGCGIKTPYLSKIVGRVEDYILTKDGRKFTRVTLIVKRAVGIKESQIVQNSIDSIIIKVVPDNNFVEESMELVVEDARKFVGNMDVSWQVVEQLERMPSGKLKFLVKRFKDE